MPKTPATGKTPRFAHRDKSLYLTVGGGVLGFAAGLWIGTAAEGDVVTAMLIFTILGAFAGYIIANRKRPRL